MHIHFYKKGVWPCVAPARVWCVCASLVVVLCVGVGVCVCCCVVVLFCCYYCRVNCYLLFS